jgi:hypothetical protein
MFLYHHQMIMKFYNKEGQEVKRTPCQVYTRVMGYLRPVSAFNVWKKSEFYSRKYFTEETTNNSEFVRKFSTTTLNIMFIDEAID